MGFQEGEEDDLGSNQHGPYLTEGQDCFFHIMWLGGKNSPLKHSL